MTFYITCQNAALANSISHGISKDLAIISDDAGQFNILIHGLCWIHADLKSYKQNPNCDDKKKLKARFESIITTITGYSQLDKTLESLHKNKKELLLVLDRPEVPLHNNSSETEIRDEVKKRKISAGTRSLNGRLSRNTFFNSKHVYFF
jgi:hypothetical protein